MSGALSPPNLLIFVDKTGEDINNRFAANVKSAGAGASLQKSTGLVQYYSTGQPTRYGLFNERLARPERTVKKTELAVERVLKMLEEENEPFSAERDRTDPSATEKLLRIYLIGDIESKTIGEALKVVRANLLKRYADLKKAEIYYVLSDSLQRSSENDEGPSQQAPIAKDWEKREIVDFCYLYPVSKQTSENKYNEIASALLTLVATTLTSHDEFKQAIDGQVTGIQREPGSPTSGTLSTGSANISNQALSNIDGNQSDKWIAVPVDSYVFRDEESEEKKTQRNVNIYEKVKKIMESWPDDNSNELSKFFKDKNITKLYRRRNKQQASDNWTAFLSSEAGRRYEGWKRDARKNFVGAEKKIQDEFQKAVNNIKQVGNTDMYLIGMAVKTLRERLEMFYEILERQPDTPEQPKTADLEKNLGEILKRPPGFSIGTLVFLTLSILILVVIIPFSSAVGTSETILFVCGALALVALPALSFFRRYRRELAGTRGVLLGGYSKYYMELCTNYINEKKSRIIKSLLDELKNMPEHWDEIAEVTRWVNERFDKLPSASSPSIAFIRKAANQDAARDSGKGTQVDVVAVFFTTFPTGIDVDALFPLKQAPGSVS